MLRVKRLIGDTEVTYESNGKDLKEDILMCSWLANAPTRCGNCESVNIGIQGRMAQDFIFAEFICMDCYAKTTMGEYKTPKGVLFVKNKKENWQVWKKEDKVETA